jgi:hypothetical protein
MATTVTATNITRLPDGVLLTGKHSLRAQTAKWTLLVTLEEPQVDPRLVKEINKIWDLLERENSSFRKVDVFGWTFRLNQVKERLGFQVKERRGFQVKEPLESQVEGRFQVKGRLGLTNKNGLKRDKRAVIGGIGTFLHWLAGVETEESMQQVKDMVKNIRGVQAHVVHKLNDMISVVNNSYSVMQQNRDSLNAVLNYVNKIPQQFDMVFRSISEVEKRLTRVERTVQVERSVYLMEKALYHFVRAMDKFKRQRSSLQQGILTQDILPLAVLREALDHGETDKDKRILPIRWYYQYVPIYPLSLDGGTLIYKATLPFIDTSEYLLFKLSTFPVPYNNSGDSVELEIDETNIGVDSLQGQVFVPHECQGRRPVVCHASVKFRQERMQCARGMVTGDLKQKEKCGVKLTRGSGETQVHQVAPGDFVVITWGERIALRCLGQDATHRELPGGTYLVSVGDECSVDAKDWILTGMRERMDRVRIAALKVQEFQPINLVDKLPETQVRKVLDRLDWKGLEPIAHRSLQPLPEEGLMMDWPTIKGNLGFVGTAIIIGLVIVGAAL